MIDQSLETISLVVSNRVFVSRYLDSEQKRDMYSLLKFESHKHVYL